jgi:hypothetical protein
MGAVMTHDGCMHILFVRGCEVVRKGFIVADRTEIHITRN